ncbi:MAG: sigma-E factor negative regulatory protein [Rudaea sp.]|nr:sigma-E factor negative regulatory protein [Rudaea sp.]
MSEQIINDQSGEQLSALMDGELPRDQLRFLLRRLDTDAGLAPRWSRFHVARASLLRQAALPLRADFNDILMQRIAAEAAPMAKRRGAALLRWAGGGAIAAAVAVVALVATRPAIDNLPATAPSVAAALVPATAPDARSAPTPLPALVNFDYAQPASFDTGTISIPRYDPRRRYEASGAGTVGGSMPYVLLTVPQSPAGTPNRPEATPQQ